MPSNKLCNQGLCYVEFNYLMFKYILTAIIFGSLLYFPTLREHNAKAAIILTLDSQRKITQIELTRISHF